MRYKVFETINGRTRRFLKGSEVTAADLADTVFSVDDLVARKKILPIDENASRPSEPGEAGPATPAADAPAKAKRG
jgi:hypothetical protein